jgi:uncharacterized protein
MTASSLRAYSIKDLARMAKRRGLTGWDAMRKDQLVRALVRSSTHRPARVVSKKTAAPTRRAASRPATVVRKSSRRSRAASGSAASIRRKPRMVKRLEQVKAQLLRAKDLAGNSLNRHFTNGTPSNKDRLVLMVRGPFWLHACWELGSRSIMRAQAAMGQDWHLARPVLRVFNLTNSAASSSSERVLRDISIHGGVRNWYIDVNQAPQTYRVEIGYLTAQGRFYSLARSNTVSTPPATAGDSLDSHWADIAEDCDKIYAMSGGYTTEGTTELQELFEERMRRPMGNAASRYGNGSDGLLPRERSFRCEIDAEIIIHGATQTGAHVVMQGEPVKVQPDGSFHVRLDLPNRRQVIPIVASTKDGVEQRTVVLAVERNTKIMEPVTRESGE